MNDYAKLRKWIAPIVAVSVLVSMYLEDRAKSRVSRVELPGFSIELPGGEVLATSQAPSGGAHKVHVHPSFLGIVTRRELTNPQLVIQWMAQSATFEEWRKDYLPVLLQAMGTKVEQSRVLKEVALDDQHWLTVIGSGEDNLPMGVGIASCGEDFQVMVIYGHYRRVDRQAEELGMLLQSVRCAVREANRTRLTAAVRLPETFGRTSDPDFEGYKSIDGEVLAINFTGGDVLRDREAYKVIVKSMMMDRYSLQLPDSALDYLPDPALRHRSSLIRVRIPGSEHTFIGSQYCELQEQTLIFLWSAGGADEARAAERLGQVGCPGDAGTNVRPFKEVSAEACKAGNQAACVLRWRDTLH